jgi:hypothetical protein
MPATGLGKRNFFYLITVKKTLIINVSLCFLQEIGDCQLQLTRLLVSVSLMIYLREILINIFLFIL